MLYQLVYTSRSRLHHDSAVQEAEIARIRNSTVVRNAQLDITGFLFSYSGKFTQLLEGSFDNVTTLCSTIFRDPRHAEAEVVSFVRIEARAFEAWDMVHSMDAMISLPQRPSFRIGVIDCLVAAIERGSSAPLEAIVSIGIEAKRLAHRQAAA